MKLLVLAIVCAVGCAAGEVAGSAKEAAGKDTSRTSRGVASSAVAWPGAIRLSSSYSPPHTRGFGFSTTQYINTFPASYQFGYPPQFPYQPQQISPFASYQPFYYPGFYPGSTVFYPTYPAAPVSPVIPQQPGAIYPQQPGAVFPQQPGAVFPQQPGAVFPQQPQPSPPSNQPQQEQGGDSDSSVIESAEYPQGDQNQIQADAPRPQPPQFPPASNFPAFPEPGQINNPPSPGSPPSGLPPQSSGPAYPQPVQGTPIPSYPEFLPSPPQFPQGSGNPTFPQFPQGSGNPIFPQFPQFPAGSFPGFPAPPSVPQSPSPSPSPSPPPSFPSSDSGDKGLNDEDTISVESA